MNDERRSLRQRLPINPLIQIPLSLFGIAGYCFLFAWGWGQLASGDVAYVNHDFTSFSWPMILLAAALTSCLLFLVYELRPVRSGRCGAQISLADTALLLLPLTPVVQYALANQDILAKTSTIMLLAVFAGIAFATSWLVPRLLANVGLGTASMIAGLVFTHTLFNMAALSHAQAWFAKGDHKIQMGVLLLTVALLWVAYSAVGPRFARGLVVVYFLAVSVIGSAQVVDSKQISLTFDGNNPLVGLVGSRQPDLKPNIYLLVYDAYVANETMLKYGIDNSAQENFLADEGFTLYPKTYSVASFTVGTMSRVFSVSTRLTGSPRSAAAGNSAVHQLLRGFGYQTNGVFWSDYFFQAEGSYYDQSYPGLRPSHWLMAKAILQGEFRFDASFAQPDHEMFLAYKKRYFSSLGPSPQLTYMHVDRPNHSQNSGECLPNETDLFRERLAQANEEMRADVSAIMQHDPNAIIVVAGDHGPYLTKNCNSTGDRYAQAEITRFDLQDRFGTFLAVRWPQNIEVVHDEITVLQDIFPAIFATIFADRRYLDARLKPRTVRDNRTSGVAVRNGVIEGGADDGKPLFAN